MALPATKHPIRFTLAVASLSAALFGSAGRWDLPQFWAFFGVLLVAILVVGSIIDPNLARERVRPARGGTDRNLRLYLAPFFLAHLIVAGLDAGRFQWSTPIPVWLSVLGLVWLAGSTAFSTWAVHVNHFFSPVVRIQEERGHRLVTSGPYRFVRHPGYAASLCACAASVRALGSWWSAVPLLPAMALIIRRTNIEDQYLRKRLAGYAEFATKTRYRLAPGVW